MADNVAVSSAASYTVATDDDGTAQHQYVKLEFGADGTFTKVSTSNNLPTTDSTAQPKLDTIITLLGTSVATQITKSVTYTSTQTGGAIWTPASGKKIAITHFTVGSYGSTAARLILWFGASGDTTYSQGTDQSVFKASFAPSATSFPGAVVCPASPILCANADYILRITTDAGLSVDVDVAGYEF